jgi:hypothetical protein
MRGPGTPTRTKRGPGVHARATCGPDGRATCGLGAHACAMRGPGALAHAIRGSGAPARATCGPGAHARASHGIGVATRVFVCATHGLGFTVRPTPSCVSATTSGSRVGSLVYHPIAIARDPRSTHSMVIRRAAGVTKPVDHLQLSAAAAPLTLPSVPTSVRSALTDPHWRRTMEEYEACCLTACEIWFLGLLRPMSPPASGSSSISSRWMTLLTGTRLVVSYGGSLSAPRWTTMKPLALSSDLLPSGLC